MRPRRSASEADRRMSSYPDSKRHGGHRHRHAARRRPDRRRDASRKSAPASPRTPPPRSSMRPACTSSPAASTATRTSTCPSAAPPRADDFETGTRAAAFGGTTTIVDFAIQARGTRMRDALDTWWKKAEGKACIDYGLHMIVTDLGACGLEDMDDMVRRRRRQLQALHGLSQRPDGGRRHHLQGARADREERRAHLHARRKRQRDRRDRRARAGRRQDRARSTTRSPARRAPKPKPCTAPSPWRRSPARRSTSCTSPREDALNQVREARDRGVPAFAETCPQYLLLSIEELERPNFEGAKYVFTPPLRPKEHLPKLWDGLKHDHLQVVSTDHCPFCFEDQKILGKDDFTKIPNGGPGIENRLQLIYHYGVNAGKLSLNRFVEITSTAPGAHLRHVSAEGRNRPRQRRRHRDLGSRARSTPSAPRPITCASITPCSKASRSRGNARTVLSRGEVIVEGGEFLGKPGRGNYLKRAATRRRLEVMPRRHDPTLYNEDLAPIPQEQRTWGTYNYASLWVAMSRLHPHLHAGLRPDRRRHELVAGHRHHPAGQPDRARPHAAQRARRREVRHSRFRSSCAPPSACAAPTFPPCCARWWPADGSAFRPGSAARPSTPCSRFSGPAAASFAGRRLGLLLRLLGAEHRRHLARHRDHQIPRRHRRALHAGHRPPAACGGSPARPAASVPCSARPASSTPRAEFLRFFIPSLTGMVGFWATVALNIPDFTRYAKSQKAQIVGPGPRTAHRHDALFLHRRGRHLGVGGALRRSHLGPGRAARQVQSARGRLHRAGRAAGRHAQHQRRRQRSLALQRFFQPQPAPASPSAPAA